MQSIGHGPAYEIKNIRAFQRIANGENKDWRLQVGDIGYQRRCFWRRRVQSGMRTFRDWLSPVVFFSNNLISLAGVVVVTAAAVTWLVFLPITLRSGSVHPYVGIVVYLLLPGIFIGGLLLIPLGIYLRRRGMRKRGELP